MICSKKSTFENLIFMRQTIAHTANSIKNYELGITSSSQSVAFSIKNYELGITSSSQSVAFSIKNYELGITSSSQSVAVRRARILQNSKIQNSEFKNFFSVSLIQNSEFLTHTAQRVTHFAFYISYVCAHYIAYIFQKNSTPYSEIFGARFLFLDANAHTKNHIIYRSSSYINHINYTNYAKLMQSKG
jgi:hypothetical protein